MSEIVYVIGDATAPQGAGNKVIAHVCNDIGGWGRGFVMALSKRWKEPEEHYRRWANGNESLLPFSLGATQLVRVDPELWVANMIGQKGVAFEQGIPPIRYDALESCLNSLALFALANKAAVHMPRIGSDLAGGKWYLIEEIIKKTLADKGVQVTVYDLNEEFRTRFSSGEHVRSL